MSDLKHTTMVSVPEAVQMQKDLEDIIRLVQHQNKILVATLRKNPPVIAQFLGSLISANNQAIGQLLEAVLMINKILNDYIAGNADGNS